MKNEDVNETQKNPGLISFKNDNLGGYIREPEKESQEEKLETIAEEIQKECHQKVEAIKAQNNLIDYQDATNVFLFRKIAELQIQIKNLNK